MKMKVTNYNPHQVIIYHACFLSFLSTYNIIYFLIVQRQQTKQNESLFTFRCFFYFFQKAKRKIKMYVTLV